MREEFWSRSCQKREALGNILWVKGVTMKTERIPEQPEHMQCLGRGLYIREESCAIHCNVRN